MTIWRRLRRIGSISPSGGLYLLPAREECVETLQCLTGVDAILKGWLLARLSDTEREAHGVALFEGLYAAFSRELKQVSSATQAART